MATRSRPVVAVAVVVLVAAVVLGGVLLSGGSQDPGRAIPLTPAPATYPTGVENGVVVAGGPAPHTLDLYEDALCPACRAFEQRAGTAIAPAVATGRVQVRYHLVNLLEQRSDPAGYSTGAANAMICAAESGAFPAVQRVCTPPSRARAGPATTPADSSTSAGAPAPAPGTPSACRAGGTTRRSHRTTSRRSRTRRCSGTGASGRRRSCSTGGCGSPARRSWTRCWRAERA
ncbi:MAG: hypothetical protein K0S40_3063 [Actinomycetospora sp.]|nr:hypothetical protein [Actinomycetospora sp.]